MAIGDGTLTGPTGSMIPEPMMPQMGDTTSLVPQKELISDEDALKLVNDTYQDYDHGRKPFERQWYRNILFLLGNQWVIWDTLENKWRKKRLADWVPTPVTNKFASTGQRLVSVLSRVEPNWQYVPSSNSSEDIASADMCKKAETIICEENDIAQIRESVAPWAIYTGNCYLLSGVEPIHGPAPIMPDMTDQSPAGEQGQLTQAEPIDYKLFTDVLSPFETYIDQTIERFKDQVKVLIVNRRSREYVQNLWNQDIDELDVAPNIHYQESIGYVTSSPEITGFLASLSRIKRITVKRLFHRPTPKYPEGLYIVVAGSKILEKKPLPVDGSEKPFIPIVHVKFDNIPGASFGRTPMDDLIQKQIQRNKIESLIELIALRMGSPIWLMPEGTVVRNFSGQPGAIVTWNSIGDKATKPDRIPGEQIPASIVQFLASIDKDIEDLASTFEALKGQSPYSGAPGVVIEQLIEQGLTRFGPSLRNVAEGYRQWMKHQIELFRVYGIAEKTLMKAGEGSQWIASKFKGTDITGAVNVKVESDSTVPRSSQVEVTKILGAIDSGLVDISDPSVRQKVLQKLHLQNLKEDVEEDIIQAVQENEAIAQGTMVDVVAFLHNHQIHIYKHRQFANSDACGAAGPAVTQAMVEHITKHHMIMDAELNPGMGMPLPGGPSSTGGGPTPSVSAKAQKQLVPGGGAKAELPQGVI